MTKVFIAALLGAAVMAAVLIIGGAVSGAYNSAKRKRSDEDSSISTMAQVMHLAIQKAPTGIVVVDISRDLILSNSSAHKLGLVYERRLNDVGWEAAEKVFQTQEDEELNLVLPARRVGAPDTIVHCLLTPLSLVDNRFVVIYARDVSEQARMEAARRDFVANVSHELKTPVGAISLLVEALNEATDDPVAVAHFSESLKRETKRMSTMITELISLSKLQGAEPLPDMGPVKVEEIVQGAVRRNQMLSDQAGIEVTVECEPDLVVEGDRSLLITAVSNLISNAINYSPEATPVSVTAVKEGDDTVAIRVTDRGIGISLANQKRIFERFFRADKARSRATGGTGLGLAIVKHVAANHKGTVKLWSRLGTGSTFTIELPLLVQEEPPSAEPEVPPSLQMGGSGAEEHDSEAKGTTRGGAKGSSRGSSKSASKGGERAGSRAGTRPSSRSSSRANSRSGSKPSSRSGARAHSRPGERSGSKAKNTPSKGAKNAKNARNTEGGNDQAAGQIPQPVIEQSPQPVIEHTQERAPEWASEQANKATPEGGATTHKVSGESDYKEERE